MLDHLGDVVTGMSSLKVPRRVADLPDRFDRALCVSNVVNSAGSHVLSCQFCRLNLRWILFSDGTVLMIMRMFDDGGEDFFDQEPPPSGDADAIDPLVGNWDFLPLTSGQITKLEEAHQPMGVPHMMKQRALARLQLHDESLDA